MAKKIITVVRHGPQSYQNLQLIETVVPDDKVDEFLPHIYEQVHSLFEAEDMAHVNSVVVNLPAPEKSVTNLHRFNDVLVDIDAVRAATTHSVEARPGQEAINYALFELSVGHYDSTPRSVRVDCKSKEETRQMIDRLETLRKG